MWFAPPVSTILYILLELHPPAGGGWAGEGQRQGVEGGGCGVESGEEGDVEVDEEEVGEEKVGWDQLFYLPG